MLAEDEVREVREDLKGCAEELGDEVTTDITQDQDGTKILGFSCYDQYYDRKYDIFHRSDRDAEAFVVRFGYDLAQSIAFDLGREEIELLLGEEVDDVSPTDVYEPTDHEIEAATLLIDELSSIGMERMKFQLNRMISNPDIRTKIRSTPGLSIRSFEIQRTIFPTEEDFGISDYYDAKTAVLSTGRKGTKFLKSALAVDVNDQGEVEEIISLSPVRLEIEED